MNEKFALQAISEIADPDKIRVVIFINNELIHVPLKAITQPILDEIEALNVRVTALETP